MESLRTQHSGMGLHYLGRVRAEGDGYPFFAFRPFGTLYKMGPFVECPFAMGPFAAGVLL